MSFLAAPLIGGAVSLFGQKQQADAQRDAANIAAQAAQFNPYSIGLSGGGGVSFGDGAAVASEGTGALTLRRGLQNLLAQNNSLLPNIGMGAGGVAVGQGVAGNTLPGLFTDALGGIDAQFGAQQGSINDFLRNRQGLMGLGGNLIGGVGNTAMQGGVADRFANFAGQQGGNLVRTSLSGSTSGILDRLRQQAQPSEERAVNSRLQSLFNRGIISSTAGERSLGELALQQENADISRQNLAEQLGLQQFSAQQGAGQSLLGLGQQGLLQGRNLNQGLAGLFGNLGMGELGRLGGLGTDMFNANLLGANSIGQRGNERLALAQNMFGFGQNAGGNLLNQTLAAGQGLLGLNADQRATIGLGGNIGGQQAAAGANVGQAVMSAAGSPTGGFLSGLGGQVLEQTLPGAVEGFRGLFSQGNKPQPPAQTFGGNPFRGIV